MAYAHFFQKTKTNKIRFSLKIKLNCDKENGTRKITPRKIEPWKIFPTLTLNITQGFVGGQSSAGQFCIEEFSEQV